MVHFSKLVPDFTNAVVGNRRYRCVEKVGSGAFGVVYRAVDQKLPKPSSPPPAQYAIKIMYKSGQDAPNTPIDQSLIPALHAREILNHKIVSSHPNIVTFHETFEDTFFTYLVLQYCPGSDLFTMISQWGPYWRNDDLVKNHFLQILDAVQHIHSNSIFHRDLKPENILCSSDGETLYLTDFGLSTDQTSSTNHGCGSVGYMSPECLGDEYEAGPYSPRHADIWSLGVILVNILVTSQPWKEPSIEDPEFCDFAMDIKYLLKKYPISKPADRLLRRMMRFSPLSRLSISDIKGAVQDMETFFMTDEELNGPLGTEHNRQVAYECAMRQRPLPVPSTPSHPLQEIDITSAIGSMHSTAEALTQKFEVELFMHPAHPHGHTAQVSARNKEELAVLRCEWANAPVGPEAEDIMTGEELSHSIEHPNKVEAAKISGMLSVQMNTKYLCVSKDFVIGSPSSGSDSAGPITPETRAVDPKIHIDIPPLDNSLEDRDRVEVDLADGGIGAAGEKFFDVKKILDTPPVWNIPDRCVIRSPVINDLGEKPGKRKWFVKDFRKLARKQGF